MNNLSLSHQGMCACDGVCSFVNLETSQSTLPCATSDHLVSQHQLL